MLPCSLQKWWKLVEDLSRYATSQAGFVFGFGAVDPALIGEGMAIFAGLLARHA